MCTEMLVVSWPHHIWPIDADVGLIHNGLFPEDLLSIGPNGAMKKIK